MKYLLILLIALSAQCQSDNTCPSYQEAVNDGTAPDKTTMFVANNKLFELGYVRDQEYKGNTYCYGHKETNLVGLEELYNLFNVKDALPKDIFYVYLIGDGKDLCKSEAFAPQDVKVFMLLYIDAQNYLRLDRIDLKTGKKESDRVSGGYASVYRHYMFEELKLSKNAFLVGFHSKDVGTEREFKRISQLNDKLYLAANLQKDEE